MYVRRRILNNEAVLCILCKNFLVVVIIIEICSWECEEGMQGESGVLCQDHVNAMTREER